MLEDRALETTMMKKTTFALSALALASSAAWAQSTPASVTLYGILDGGVVHTTGVTNKNQVVSGIMEGSRLGVRGNEDIGGGFRAIFTLENRTELNNGTLSNRPPSGAQLPDRFADASLLVPALCPAKPCAIQAAVTQVNAGLAAQGLGVNIRNGFWDRQAYVGLVTPVGAVLLGRQYTPAYEVSATFDIMGTQSSLSAGQVASFPASTEIRTDNALQYRIVFGGLTASAMYALGGSPTNSKASRLGGAMAMYRAGPFAVGLGYNQRNNDIGQKSLRSAVFGASVDVGPGTLSGLYVDFKDDNPSGVSTLATGLAPAVGVAAASTLQQAYTNALRQDGKLMHIGYKMPVGVHTLYFAYSTFNDKRSFNADTSSYGAAFTYALSKRTDINAVLTHFDNKNLAQAAPGQAGFLGGFTTSAGTDANSFALGLRHRF
jgi:general bacterial porin, GBP family